MAAGATFRAGPHALPLSEVPHLVGILNVTPDSFSDGGSFVDVDTAVGHALRLEDDGAAILDVGGVSTRPGSEEASLDEELRRTIPVIERLAPRLGIPISIDTYRAEVFRAARDAGAAILNDVTALTGDESMLDALASTDAGVIVMHMRGTPRTMQEAPRYGDVVHEIRDYLQGAVARVEAAGVERDRLVIDPGIGFGKTVKHNLEILRRIGEFAEVGCPVLVGTSRKSFMGKLLEREDPLEREYGTAATTAHLFSAGVQFIRVHDVRASADVITMLCRIHGRGDSPQ